MLQQKRKNIGTISVFGLKYLHPNNVFWKSTACPFIRKAEDKKLIRISLMKTSREAGNCWTSLLEGEYCADPLVQEQMQKKLTLERFQRENPGFDFSGADISGNYAGGGPDFSNIGK
ncbi:NudC domain-containing protein 2 [Acipenser ruthenus]|uniref:NudC domain-containing protein 2 n=1 Tax=Acipenser ruthenus TaxID=7906 RepID=A0A444UUR0_ACIRT|nr:NudC domain-containing protein 2 [Acipenser ruthenus]